MIMKYTLAIGLMMVLNTLSLSAKELDTVVRKDGNGWEYIQVVVIANKQTITEGYMLNGKKEGVWNEFAVSKYPKH